MSAAVPASDEGADLGVEFADGAEGAAVDGLAFDDREPDLDQVIQDAWVGVKCTTTRGFAASQVWTAGCLSAA